LVTREGAASGVMIRGMNADDFLAKPLLKKSVEGQPFLQNFKDENVFIGIEMARRLHLNIGDVITIISPKPKSTPFGSMPRSKNYIIGGTFDVGMYEYNNSFIFMPLVASQAFFEMPERVSMIEILTDDMMKIEPVKNRISRVLGESYLIRGWQQSNVSFFNALDVERNVMFLILMLIILIAAFNIISSLIMLVKDKSRDIAILRTMGASKAQVLRIFLITGASIGIAGTLAGTLLGLLITTNLDSIQHGIEAITHSSLFPAEVYFLTRLPAIIDWHEVFLIVGMALVLSFCATLYPAWRAAKLDPVEALRYA
jgi:lipoprotein-releasing system permease protein